LNAGSRAQDQKEMQITGNEIKRKKKRKNLHVRLCVEDERFEAARTVAALYPSSLVLHRERRKIVARHPQ